MKIRRRPPKSPVPEPKTLFCKTLIITGVENVAVLVHINNQPISKKGGFSGVFRTQFSAKNQKKYNRLNRDYNPEYQCVTKRQRC
ncbi:MAG: hypothetical protein IKW77_09490 [Salinivirgaceae bacterium]|nr:hypothetical protein [Salinivirgaceae bacterium]